MTEYPTDRARSYTQALLGDTLIEANSRAELRRKVLGHLIRLGTPPANLEATLSDAICKALPMQRRVEECRICDEEQTPPELRKERVLRMDDVFRFLKGMSRWLADGGGFVEAAEAERRASICARCPRNIEIPGCKSCAGIVGQTLELLAGKGTRYDASLESCEVCGCQNRAAVHFPMSAQATELDYPEHCWKRGSGRTE